MFKINGTEMVENYTLNLYDLDKETLRRMYYTYADNYSNMVDQFGEDSKEVNELRKKFIPIDSVYREKYGRYLE